MLFFSIISGCASIQQPTGGPRDTQPPKALEFAPKNYSTNFTASKIEIEFDEYFRLQNEFKEVSISPEQERPPVLKKNGRTLEIEFQEALIKNTTYTINFGNAITDVNENNVIKNFTYVFSTGATLDSASISGKVRNAYTGLNEPDALVFLFPLMADTAFGRKKPSIYTRTDTAGKYRLSNLKPGSYKIYALKEQNADKLYFQGVEQIGFIKMPLILKSKLDSIDLSIFREIPRDFKILERRIGSDGTILLTFNRPVNAPGIKISDGALDASKLTRFNNTRDSVRIWLNDLSFDSVRVSVSENSETLQSVNISRAKKDTYTRILTAQDNLESGIYLNPRSSLNLVFGLPVTNADRQKVTFLEDSIPRINFTLEKDSGNFLAYNLRYPWKEKSKYEIRFAEGAFTGIFKTTSKYFTKRVELNPSTNYGSVDVQIILPAKDRSYIFEFINDAKKAVYTAVLTKDTTIKFQNYRTGKYFARIVYDENKNQAWDTGDLSKLQQPEKVWYDPRPFTVRTNWERKEIITVPQ